MAQSLFTFSRGYATIDPDIKTPYILNWSVGIQRELWRDSAIEVRYLANAGRNLWRSYDHNEVNIFENGFLREFQQAQRNLQINQAAGVDQLRQHGLCRARPPTPIFDAAFGARGGQAALPAASGYTNGTFITQLQQGQAGRLANTMAGNPIYLCRMVGNACRPVRRWATRRPARIPINFFQMNPYAAGQPSCACSPTKRGRAISRCRSSSGSAIAAA